MYLLENLRCKYITDILRLCKMENLNLVELLKDVPAGTSLYSPICGYCELVGVITTGTEFCIGKYPASSSYTIKVRTKDNCEWSFTENGHYYDERGECLLFPSRDNHDWSTFKVEKEGFKVGDYVKEKRSNNVFRIKQQDDYLVTFTSILTDSTDTERTISTTNLDRYEKVEKFDPSWLEEFDRILVRDGKELTWFATQFSHLIRGNKIHPYVINNNCAYRHCIPFNEETKHLVGTNNTEPEFYKIS